MAETTKDLESYLEVLGRARREAAYIAAIGGEEAVARLAEIHTAMAAIRAVIEEGLPAPAHIGPLHQVITRHTVSPKG